MPFIMYHLTHYIPMLLLLLATYCFLPVISLYPQNTHHRLMTMPPTFYAVSLWNTNTSYHLHLICYYLYCTCYHLHAISLWKTNPPAMYPLHPITLLLHSTAYIPSPYGILIYPPPIAYMLPPTCYHSMEDQYTYCLSLTCYCLHAITLCTHAPTAYRLHATAYMLSL